MYPETVMLECPPPIIGPVGSEFSWAHPCNQARSGIVNIVANRRCLARLIEVYSIRLCKFLQLRSKEGPSTVEATSKSVFWRKGRTLHRKPLVRFPPDGNHICFVTF